MTTHSIALSEPLTERERWKNTILAGLANYIDAGSIVAGAAALALWVEVYNLSPNFVGMLAAFSANAIAAGVGALIGGRLCDLFGRKKIYQYDMLFYAFGMAWLVFAQQPWMIVVGFVLVGLAVGADIPASWSLIAEVAPDDKRGQHSGVAQLLWNLGPLVVLMMFLVLAPFGVLGARIVFAHLMVLALVLTLLRSRMRESQRWEAAQSQKYKSASTVRQLLEPRHLRSMIFLIAMYGIFNLWAGTFGIFMPYLLRTVGAQSQAVAVGLQAISGVIAMAALVFVFMRLVDRVNQKLLFGLGALSQIVAMSLLALLPLTPVVVLVFWVLAGFGFTQAFYQLWSGELFPTLLRSTAQGITFAVVRIAMGIWSFFVPALASVDFTRLAWILTGFLVISALIGLIWAPRTAGKSLEQIQAEMSAGASGSSR